MWPRYWSSSSFCSCATRCTAASPQARPRHLRPSAAFAPRPTAPRQPCLSLSPLHPGPTPWSSWTVSPGGPVTNPRDPSLAPTSMALLAQGVAGPRHAVGPGLRLTKLFTVFKTYGEGVRGTGAQQESPIFLSLGLGPCPCLCLWGLGSCKDLKLGVPPLVRDPPSSI